MHTLRGDLRVDPLVRRLAALLRREEWLPRGASAIAAVSGGGDSVALLLVLSALAREFSWQIEVFHAHHGLRGQAADSAAGLVRRLSEAMQLPLHLVNLHIENRAGRSFEEAARHHRLEALRSVASGRGFTHAVLGHTLDDLAETVLHRALRGTGLTGLAAMRPVVEHGGLRLVRPLLGETRQSLRLFLRDHGARWDEDETNELETSVRNRIRHRVRPLLAREVNARADESLARLALHAAQDDAQLEADVDAALERLHLDLRTGELDLVSLRTLSPSLQRRALRRWMMIHADCPLPPTSRQVEETVDNIRAKRPPPRWSSFRGLIIGIRAQRLTVSLPGRLERRRWPQITGGPVNVTESCSVTLPHGWVLHTRVIATGEPLRLLASQQRPGVAANRFLACLDADALRAPLCLRAGKRGERFHPFGLSYTKTLRHFLSGEHIPRSVREHLPVLADAERIVWVAGCRIAEAVRITASTRRILEVTVEPPRE